MKTDPKLQKKWEDRLEKAGLGVYQPMTDNSEGETEVGASSAISDKMGTLRKRVGGDDQFMEGHQVTAMRSIEREIPEWTASNKEVQRVLLTLYPKLNEKSKAGKKQRKSARLCMHLIYLYFRMGLPRQVVARELKISKELVRSKIYHIEMAARGLTWQGKPRVGQTPRTALESDTPEGTGREENEVSQGALVRDPASGSGTTAGATRTEVQLQEES